MGYCLYSSKEDNSSSSRSGIHIAGSFYLRTSMTGHLLLVSTTPRNNTPPCQCPWIHLKAARIMPLTIFVLKVLASVSSLSRVVCVGQDQLSSMISKYKAEYFPIPHRSKLCMIIQRIYLTLCSTIFVFRIIPMNTMWQSAFQRHSLAPRNSFSRHFKTSGRHPLEEHGILIPSGQLVVTNVPARHCYLKFLRPYGDFRTNECDFHTPGLGGDPPQMGQPLPVLLPTLCGQPGISGNPSIPLALARPVLLAAVYLSLVDSIPITILLHVQPYNH